MTIIKSRCPTRLKPITQKIKSEKQIQKSPLPRNLQSFQRIILSGNSFTKYK